MSTIKSSRLARLGQMGKGLIKAGAQIGAEVAESKFTSKIQDQSRRLKAAKEIVESMGELKGALMKVGQMISITDDLFIPKEVTEVFKKLQNQVSFYEYSRIREIYFENFKRYPEDDFVKFSKEPIAAASIGQVHLATNKQGEKLAVKIQYPEIVRAIGNDLKNISAIKKIILLISPDLPNVDHILEELREHLIDECNYEKEKQNMEIFRELYREKFPQVVIPKVYEEFSSDKILTTEFINADNFSDTHQYSQADRDNLGTNLYDCFLYSFFTHNLLHSDPHEGNYLFLDNKIYMLDFGSVKRFEPKFVDFYAIMCHSIMNKNRELFIRSATELGVLTPDAHPEQIDYFYQLACDIYDPFMKEGSYPIENLNPFKMIGKFINEIDIKNYDSAPHKDFLMIDRANIGLFSKLKRWQSHVSWETGRELYQIPREQKALKTHKIKL